MHDTNARPRPADRNGRGDADLHRTGGRELGGVAWLAAVFGRDRPAAFIEDAVAIGAALLDVALL